MAAISAINLALTGAALQLARRQAGRLPGVLRGMLAFLSLFSLLLIATAASKLALYIASFGMTRLRVLTALFLLLLAVCFVCVLLRLFLPRFSYGKPLLCLLYTSPGTFRTAFSTRALQAAQLIPVTSYCCIFLVCPLCAIRRGGLFH